MSFNVVAILGIVKEDEILLIKRDKFPFTGLWGLLGGKVESGESIDATAIREVVEETGLDANFHSFGGSVKEHVMEDGEIVTNLLLLVCRMTPKSSELKSNYEGELGWFKISELDDMKDKIIPNDLHMLNKMILNDTDKNFKSVIEKNGDNYRLLEFAVNDYERREG